MKPEIESAIDAINVTLNAGGMNTINIVLAFVMYGVALGIKPHMFVDVFKKPKSVVVGVCCQLILLPLLTFLLALLMDKAGWISWTMALGMILVASCPGGNISNFISSLSKANIELSVCLTAISTALAVFMTPFNFWLYGNLFLKFAAVHGEVPYLTIPLWDVFKTIFILLGIPLTLGILTSHYLPKVAEKLKKPFQYVSVVFFLVMVVLSFMGNMEAGLEYRVQYGYCLQAAAPRPADADHRNGHPEFGPRSGAVARHVDLCRSAAPRWHAGHHGLVGCLAHHFRSDRRRLLQPL